ncbi:DNA-dependent metalloprotease SPRTN [Boleophthalmus pectinirostris]|uniref:DNA-dependent metalloprotease SPRTN n=1 Tax=Boleophthalmus pectinirostris TaxID=150288 RepID=UPI00242DC507|nr:DNA-dependent metalloprotease SPRTN [Boleophthalmus pectinirostris]
MDADLLLAIKLQEQFDNEYQASLFPSDGFEDNPFEQSNKKRRVETAGGGSDVVPYWKPKAQPERPLSIVDESWEMLDPNPDVRSMFLEFNDMFFWGKLSGVEVKWSPRMTLCAGVCSYEGRGGLCSIRLSEPLLKLRPRKDLVETLLHEMIHALLFVTQNNRDRDGHGPEFCKHMNRINQASGTKISIYHTFHDEVDVYRQHWWRCDGPCQNRKPYFGYVKRAMNRAPSHLDPWWEDHRRTCGGTYTKVKEPEGYGKKKGSKKDKTSASDKPTSISGKEKTENSKPSTSGSQDIRNIIPFTGKGFLLGGKSQQSTSSSASVQPPATVSSPLKTLTTSPIQISSPSPIRSGLETKATSSAFPSVRPIHKPPTKRSVSNTKVFVNINGSPVRISKPLSSNTGNDGAEKVRQRSIGDLFNKSNSKSSTSVPNLTPSKSTPSKSIHSKYPPVIPTNNSPEKATHSKYFNEANTNRSSTGGQGSKKRSWEDSRSSASIFDYFQKTIEGNSVDSISANSSKPKSATVTTSAPPQTSMGQNTATSSSSSSSAVMVSCPVCLVKVQEAKINEHLDSCLS